MLFLNFFGAQVSMDAAWMQHVYLAELSSVYFQSKGLSRDLIKQIKQQRRTMKNRGYAAQCRSDFTILQLSVLSSLFQLQKQPVKQFQSLISNGVLSKCWKVELMFLFNVSSAILVFHPAPPSLSSSKVSEYFVRKTAFSSLPLS